jgi:D-glycero-D-manno-heptose 1,7-bisphosphate phosphatase
MSGSVGVFLDRDGTLNVEVDYIRTPDELQIIEGAAKAVRKLNEHGIITCVISNQSGIARGFLTEADLIPIHAKLREELLREGAKLGGIYYCPHHPTAGIAPYNVECECRKPKPGMLQQGARELNIALQRSFVVGDSVVDMQAGNAVDAATILVQTGYGRKSLQTCNEQNIPISFVADSIVEAVDFILDNVKGDRIHND